MGETIKSEGHRHDYVSPVAVCQLEGARRLRNPQRHQRIKDRQAFDQVFSIDLDVVEVVALYGVESHDFIGIPVNCHCQRRLASEVNTPTNVGSSFRVLVCVP